MEELNPFYLGNASQDIDPTSTIIINEEQDKKSIYVLAQKYIKELEKKKKTPNYIKDVLDAIKSIEYYCDPLGDYHGVVNINGVVHIFNIDSEKFLNYLNKIVCDRYGIALDQKKIKTCLGIAWFDIANLAKPAKFIRRIAHTDSALYINRGLKLPAFLKVDFTTGEREYVSAAPFIPKIKAMDDTALDYKQSDGTYLKKFFEILEIHDNLDQLLIITYATSKMFPDRRGVLLHIIGKEGAGKTTLAWAIKNLVDPGDVDTLPAKKDELVQLFDHNAVPVLDNLGTLTKEFSNTICAMVTGVTYRKRAHFTNDEDFIYQVINNGILASIELPILAKDLISRTFFIKKEPFKNNRYTQDDLIRDDIIKILPFCFDEIINLTIIIKKELIGYKIYGNNRNMDFIAIGKIVSKILYGDESIFDKVVERNNGYAINENIRASHEAAAIIEFMADKQEYVNTPTKTIADLDVFGCVDNAYTRSSVHFTRRLNLAKDLLRAKGITFIDSNTNGKHGHIIKFVNHHFIEPNGEVLDAPTPELAHETALYEDKTYPTPGPDHGPEPEMVDHHVAKAAAIRLMNELLGPKPDPAVEEEETHDDETYFDTEAEEDEEEQDFDEFIESLNVRKPDPDAEFDPYTGEWK